MSDRQPQQELHSRNAVIVAITGTITETWHQLTFINRTLGSLPMPPTLPWPSACVHGY